MNKQFKFDPKNSDQSRGKLSAYKALIVGERSLLFLCIFELFQLILTPIPGAIGIFSRSLLFPLLFPKIEKGVVIGKNVTFRHPHKISLAKGCIIDDNVLIDAKGTDNQGITIENGVFIGRNSILSCKNGNICIRKNANIGFNCEVFSSSNVTIGASSIIAAYCYLVGGGAYHTHSQAIPMSEHPDFEGKGGIEIGNGAWLGAHVVVLDGVTIGHDSVVAAGAVATHNTAPMTINGGVPAKQLSERKEP